MGSFCGPQGSGGGGGGGSPASWAVAAKGLLAGATAGVVHTAVVGRSYVLVVLNADTSASNMSSGDEDLVTLLEIQNGNPTVQNTIAGSINQNAVHLEIAATGGSGIIGVQVFSNVRGGGGTDDMLLQYTRATGQFTATHTQGADVTNGVYVLFEKS